ncbi:MAG: hypothetical protein MZW92_65210 [Comamonadaceae bacterium]|nr:hypothetical protein [Comamonadaceae bacterium]
MHTSWQSSRVPTRRHDAPVGHAVSFSKTRARLSSAGHRRVTPTTRRPATMAAAVPAEPMETAMPQPPADWVPFDDRTPPEPAAAEDVGWRSEAFAEDLGDAPLAGVKGPPRRRSIRDGFHDWRFKRRAATVDLHR